MRGACGSRLLRLGLVLLALPLAGCVRGCTSSRPPIHLNPNMDSQAKLEPQEASSFFYDGSAMRLPVPGTVARGRLRQDDPPFYTGKDADGNFVAANPLAGEDVAARGAARYGIYCAPCHSNRGNGKGILTDRAGVPVPAFTDERILGLAEGELFDVITNGKGLMPSYRWPIPARDRWAIVTHVRGLQQGGRP